VPPTTPSTHPSDDELEDEPYDGLPPLAMAKSNHDMTCVTFAFAIDERIPGWIALLRFVMPAGLVELASFRVEYFGGPPDAEPDGPQVITASDYEHAQRNRMPPLDLFERWSPPGEPPPQAPSTSGDGPMAGWDREAANLLASPLLSSYVRWVQAIASEPIALPPHGGLSTRQLRGIRLGNFASLARQEFLLAPHDAFHEAGWLEGEERKEEQWRGGGRRGRDDLHYALLAAEYVALLGTTKKPNDVLAERRGETANAITAQIKKTRERGMLTRTRRGRPGGELTDMARKLLQEAGYGTR
jgi:hypothetical protein